MRLSPLLVLLALALFLVLLVERPAEQRPAEGGTEGLAATEALEGVVVGVHDGDTITLEHARGRSRIRLGQIDAPELGQPWGEEAQRALRRLADHRSARVEVRDVDEYGRRVGDLFVGPRHVNEALVRGGHAWAYRRYVRDEEILDAETAARREEAGLWALPEAEREPPWAWRRANPRR